MRLQAGHCTISSLRLRSDVHLQAQLHVADLAHAVAGLGHRRSRAAWPRAGTAPARPRRAVAATASRSVRSRSRSACRRCASLVEGAGLVLAWRSSAALKTAFLPLDLGGQRLRPLHLGQDLVLARPDLALHALDLVEHGRVFLVGLHLHELALVLRALGLQVLQLALVVPARLLAAVQGLAGGVEAPALLAPGRPPAPALLRGISASSASTRRSSLSACCRWISSRGRGSSNRDCILAPAPTGMAAPRGVLCPVSRGSRRTALTPAGPLLHPGSRVAS